MTDHKGGREKNPARHRLAGKEIEHHIHGLAADVVERLAHRGERRRNKTALFDVAEAGDGNVVRHAQAARRERGKCAERHLIVCRDKGVKLNSAMVQHHRHRALAGTSRPIALHHTFWIGGKSVFGERIEEHAEPELGAGVFLWPADERDPLVAMFVEQVTHEVAEPGFVVDEHCGHVAERLVDRHGGLGQETAVQILKSFRRRIRAERAGNNKAVDIRRAHMFEQNVRGPGPVGRRFFGGLPRNAHQACSALAGGIRGAEKKSGLALHGDAFQKQPDNGMLFLVFVAWFGHGLPFCGCVRARAGNRRVFLL